MKLVMILLLAALPITSACQPSSPHVALASHPPSVDLTCPDEPLIDAMLVADPSGVTFDAAVRKAGQDCRDALARVCRWHQERGAVVICPVALKP
jgi:acetyl esterase/lipase